MTSNTGTRPLARACVDYTTMIGLGLVLILAALIWPVKSEARFIREGETVIYGRSDTVFKVCNGAQHTLYLALVYQNVWKIGEQPTWPAKGWFQLNRGGCNSLAVNGLIGVMAVMVKDSAGQLQPHYRDGDTALADVNLSNGQSKLIKPENLCLDEAPFSGYKDHYKHYYRCDTDEQKVPFHIVFDAYGNRSYTLTLD